MWTSSDIDDLVREVAMVLKSKYEYMEVLDVFNMTPNGYVDIRLQLMDDKTWYIHTGNAQNDQDHRGCWGSSVMCKNSHIDTLAEDLVDDAMEDASQQGVYVKEMP